MTRDEMRWYEISLDEMECEKRRELWDDMGRGPEMITEIGCDAQKGCRIL